MPDTPSASIVIPTRGRPHYLDATLGSIAPQADEHDGELIVVSDGLDDATAEITARHGARLVVLPEARGANAARNRGIAASSALLVVFVDDDVEAPPGWLAAMLDGARSNPEHDVFGGPIRPRLDGGGPRACGREPPPITSLDFGVGERDVPLVWSANMAVRRSALDRIGLFDETIRGRGEEEDWEHRYAAAGGRIRYLPHAGLDHRRTAADARLRSLARAAYALGRSSRRYDVRKEAAPTLRTELRTLAGCGWHTVRRRCAYGIVMAAGRSGRLAEALTERRHPIQEPHDFMSGTSGQVWGIRATTYALARDALAEAHELVTARRWRLRRAAERSARRSVLVVAVERDDQPNLLAEAREELLSSRHDVLFASAAVGSRGKWENITALIDEHGTAGSDWLVVLDDDVRIPRGFLDVFLFVAERFQLRIAQPAHRARSHAAWQVTRRRVRSVARETQFVESGPLVAFHHSAFETLLPFPPLRAGWGLDAHWSAIARERRWRIGVIDATPVVHGLRRTGALYDRQAAIEEGRSFLENKPYIRADEAQKTLLTHRKW